jgi:hypothetical protein
MEQELKKEVTLYSDLLRVSEQRLKDIQAQLAESFASVGKNYTDGQVRNVKLAISQAFGQSDKGLGLRDIIDFCASYPTELVEREVRKLARNRHSPIVWNGKRGMASRYYRREVVL